MLFPSCTDANLHLLPTSSSESSEETYYPLPFAPEPQIPSASSTSTSTYSLSQSVLQSTFGTQFPVKGRRKRTRKTVNTLRDEREWKFENLLARNRDLRVSLQLARMEIKQARALLYKVLKLHRSGSIRLPWDAIDPTAAGPFTTTILPHDFAMLERSPGPTISPVPLRRH